MKKARGDGEEGATGGEEGATGGEEGTTGGEEGTTGGEEGTTGGEEGTTDGEKEEESATENGASEDGGETSAEEDSEELGDVGLDGVPVLPTSEVTENGCATRGSTGAPLWMLTLLAAFAWMRIRRKASLG